MRMKDMRVHVVGAGIAGLAAATALARRGATVTVSEQATALEAVGAGIQISPNGAAVLAALGLEADAARLGNRLGAVEMRDGPSGRPVLRLDLDAAGYDHPYRAFHRADLVGMLAEAAAGAGAQIRLGHTIGPQNSIPDDCDVTIGADGIRSALRARMFPQGTAGADEPAFTGNVAWRATVPLEVYPAPMFDGAADHARLFMGPGRHLVCYPLRARGLLNIVAVEERRAWQAEGWMYPDAPENLRRAFAGMGAEVRALLDPVEIVHAWGLSRHPVPDVWHRGTCGLIGDAVHPTLPFMAQGGNLALEDAWVLAETLAEAPDIETAWRDFTAKRLARVRRAVAAAGRNARIYHMSPAPLRRALHGAMGLAGRIAPEAPLRRFDWLYREDVTGGKG